MLKNGTIIHVPLRIKKIKKVVFLIVYLIISNQLKFNKFN